MFNLNILDNIGKYVDAALEAAQIFIRLEAMKAENNLRQDQGKAQAYDENAFLVLHDRISYIRKRLNDS